MSLADVGTPSLRRAALPLCLVVLKVLVLPMIVRVWASMLGAASAEQDFAFEVGLLPTAASAGCMSSYKWCSASTVATSSSRPHVAHSARTKISLVKDGSLPADVEANGFILDTTVATGVRFSRAITRLCAETAYVPRTGEVGIRGGGYVGLVRASER
jgi:hypothetical protein